MLLGMILMSGAASAQVTYDYVGQPITVTVDTATSSGGPAPYTETFPMLGSITLAQALNPNEANQQVVPLAYSFSNTGGPQSGATLSYDPAAVGPPTGSIGTYGNTAYLVPGGANPITSGWAAGYGSLPTLTFYTVGGSITAFDMTFAGFNDYIQESLTLTSSGDSFFGTYCNAHCIGYAAQEEGSNQAGGTWSAVAAPEIDPTSLASGMTLLLGGLLVLRGRLSRGSLWEPTRGPCSHQTQRATI